jgi:hypothetical protein
MIANRIINEADAAEVARCRAAIETIVTLAGNLRTIRRGSFPVSAKRRLSEILRLSAEIIEILERRLFELEKKSASRAA